MKSKLLEEFIHEIKYQNRDPENRKVLELLDDKSTNPQITITTDKLLYRARIVTQEEKINKEKDFYGYNAKDSFIPPAHLTSAARANYQYIPCLYCANHAYIALAEVRPHIGAKVSIATIAVKEPLNLLDFTMQPPFPKMPEVKQGILEDLSELFSRPVAKNDEILDYIPTQFIAEYVKRLGYDGITFSSSVTPEFRKNEPDRHNVVVFNYEKCEAIKSNMFEVERTYVEAKQIDSDRNLLNIESYILERLREI